MVKILGVNGNQRYVLSFEGAIEINARLTGVGTASIFAVAAEAGQAESAGGLPDILAAEKA